MVLWRHFIMPCLQRNSQLIGLLLKVFHEVLLPFRDCSTIIWRLLSIYIIFAADMTIIDTLLSICSQKRLLDSQLLSTPDFSEKWKSLAPDFMSDAVSQINQYPQYVIACAAYIGMAAASFWDADFEKFKALKYKDLLGSRGFDNMDDKISDNILKLLKEISHALSQSLISCTEAAINWIRHQDAEPGSEQAFYVVVQTLEAMYQIGVSIELRILGYYGKIYGPAK